MKTLLVVAMLLALTACGSDAEEHRIDEESRAQHKAYWADQWRKKVQYAKSCKHICDSAGLSVAHYSYTQERGSDCQCGTVVNRTAVVQQHRDDFVPGLVTGYVAGKVLK